MENIKTKEDALVLADKISKFANSEKFRPFKFESDFKKYATDSQREYYWAVIVKMQYDFFKNDILKFCEFVFKVARQSLSKDLIHTLNKFLYNKCNSTQDLKTDAREAFHLAIREDMFHFCKLDIPPPNELITTNEVKNG